MVTIAGSAAYLAIGNELLVGRTQEKNLLVLAKFLEQRGLRLVEARLVSDQMREIRSAARALSRRADSLFISGGIGPTHDDITTAAIAAEFGCPLEISEEHFEQMNAYYKQRGESMTAPRLKMVRLPRGAEPIANPLSIAPGFRIDNVYVMAGVPQVFEAMLQTLADKFTGGDARLSETLHTTLHESRFAEALQGIQERYPESEIGSYPRLQGERAQAQAQGDGAKIATTTWKNAIVVSDTDPQRLDRVVKDLRAMLKSMKV